MNLIENYILEVIEVKEVEVEGVNLIYAKLRVDCYGRESITRTSFRDWTEWEKVKEQGYYLA